MAQVDPVNPYILKLITNAIAEEDTTKNYYNALADEIPIDEDKEILREMALDEAKHYEMFNDMYYKLSGEKLEPPLRGPVILPSGDILLELSKSLLKELETSEEYRKILFAFLNQQIRDTMTEIIIDEQNHASKLNYLLTKGKM